MSNHTLNAQLRNRQTVLKHTSYSMNPPRINEEEVDFRCPTCRTAITQDGGRCPECEQAWKELDAERLREGSINGQD